ncbi:hypothetical protein CPAST_c29500 [Clostridium pasteurianum DSM 525 = ATCC 6013]|uniref:DUF7852 domain-containing protein n=2 Tax=Clostridium pasteurianum TaxID=1501 RepID=A0A0H3J509_CLOPA|nr:hypothetical protein [Clostridium pasteurianum]AJA49016.1 hypothetical protein CPAST_c29500 [Clostridium pasteurianum DSM 525 = ATCC 6013]AJA53004.1 hypothetical protein CLPA_c29500 [Clostridium pasteurianum DSM 525 = ATCC 6013]AOZ76222.1 hypothetical protein AQ983_14345 [Clostridium pasteurianum DSM 525 = ATCC 6013]AOZ80018.1 hypothetical protein AQ984_14340 [Clostridium pasteurianum]ELP60312.1 hypothetical protein F502_06732 [Clostridium pasteurianum DSM 525 = ATCC 6013]
MKNYIKHMDTSLIPIKVPIIISSTKVYINVENKVTLDSYATAIKHITRKVFLKKYILISKSKKLFLRGSIRKSITYSEPIYKNGDKIEGKIKNKTIYVPFNCVTDVDYIVNPEIQKRSLSTLVTISKSGTKKKILSESYNEVAPIYCEIVDANFKELNIKEDIEPYINNSPNIHIFKTITQQTTICLTIRLIQNQEIFINNITKL